MATPAVRTFLGPGNKHPKKSPLWAITSYFNPAGYLRRRENYRVFRRHLDVPLVTVELSFNGRFELRSGDAEVLIQLHGGDVMWQKERLLNVGLESLPAECEAVAWVDGDVIFDTNDWAERTLEALGQFRLVQLFSERHDVAAGVREDDIRTAEGTRISRAVGLAIERGDVDGAKFPTQDLRETLNLSMGLAWACRLDLLKKHSFYDVCIAGGGDRALLSAAMGAFESARQSLQMNAMRSAHYLRWAHPYWDSVGGAVGHVEGRLFHQWHGEPRRRQYTERDRMLADLDPSVDIAVDHSGCWRWNSDKPAMHAAVLDYFPSRREDD